MKKIEQDQAEKPAGIYDLDGIVMMEDTFGDAFTLACLDGKVYIELGDNAHGDPVTDLALDGDNLVALHQYLTQVLSEGSA